MRVLTKLVVPTCTATRREQNSDTSVPLTTPPLPTTARSPRLLRRRCAERDGFSQALTATFTALLRPGVDGERRNGSSP